MNIRQILRAFKKHAVLQQIMFWLISIVLFTVVLVYLVSDFSLSTLSLEIAMNILITMAFLAVSVYINLLWLIPAFFNRRRFFLFGVLELGNICLFILLNYMVTYFYVGGHPANFTAEVIAEFILVLIFLLVSTLLVMMRDSIALHDVELKMKDVEKQKIEAELRALKAQVNPHFLFNTLNSLYALSLDGSSKTPDLVLKLSDLMRYVIYDSKDDLVAMGRQLEFLRNYVHLERIRCGDGLEITFDVNGDRTDIRIAPLLYLAFVENAFKHGAKNPADRPYIGILFDLEKDDRVFFSIRNRKDPYHNTQSQGGVGLSNVRKQLELLYPGRHALEVRESATDYRVELTIFTS